jgi:hypothetical protein
MVQSLESPEGLANLVVTGLNGDMPVSELLSLL